MLRTLTPALIPKFMISNSIPRVLDRSEGATPARLLSRQAMLILLCLLLPASSANATAGFAEYSWYFHDRPGQWIEWHHGDICPPEAARKNCVLIRQSKTSGRRPGPLQPAPYDKPPQGLYLTTVIALLPPALMWLGLARLRRRWRQRTANPSGWSLRSTWALGLMTVSGLAWMPHALAVLFPASPGVDGWHIAIGLSFNILIAVAPFTLWRTYRSLFPPPGRVGTKGWRRLFLWPALLLSSLLAPLLLWGPPNLLMFLFPPTMLPNILVSLLAVWAASKVTNAISRKILTR
jgi:hypothetical protein